MNTEYILNINDRLSKSICSFLPEKVDLAQIVLKIALLKTRPAESWSDKLFNKISN